MRAFTYFFGIFTCLFGIVCAIFELPMIYRIIVALFVAVSVYLVLKYSKCPQCNEYGVNFNPFSKEFGFCKKCHHKEQ